MKHGDLFVGMIIGGVVGSIITHQRCEISVRKAIDKAIGNLRAERKFESKKIFSMDFDLNP